MMQSYQVTYMTPSSSGSSNSTPLTPSSSQANAMASPFSNRYSPTQAQVRNGPAFQCSVQASPIRARHQSRDARDAARRAALRAADMAFMSPPSSPAAPALAAMVSSNEMIPTSSRRIPQGSATPLNDAQYTYVDATSDTQPVSYNLEVVPFTDAHYTLVSPTTQGRAFNNLFDPNANVLAAAMESTAHYRRKKQQRLFPIANQPAHGLPNSASLARGGASPAFARKSGVLSSGASSVRSGLTSISTTASASTSTQIATTTANKSLTEFHLFGKLAPEIQRYIWDIAVAAAESRIIELRHDQYQGFYSNTLTCPLLHVCFHARQAGLKRYQPLTIEDNFTGVYINWEMDTVFFGPYEDHSNHFPLSEPDKNGVYEEILEKCKKLAVGVETMHGLFFGRGAAYGNRASDIWGFADFKNLSSLTVVWKTTGNVVNEHGLLQLVDDHKVGDDFDGPLAYRIPHVPASVEREHTTITNILASMKEKNDKLDVSIKNAYRGGQAGLDLEEKSILVEETEKKLVEWRKDVEQRKVREGFERFLQRESQVQQDKLFAEELQRQLDRRERD